MDLLSDEELYMDLQNLKPKTLKLIEIIFVKRNYRINLLLQRASYQNLKSHSLFFFSAFHVIEPLHNAYVLCQRLIR